MTSRTLGTCAPLFAALVLTTASAFVQAPSMEPAIAVATRGADVKWGPCPDPLPKGCQLAVLHGDPAQPNADVLLKLPARSSVPKHTHTSAERIILMSGTVHATYDGQPRAELKPGMYAYGPAGKPHTAACVSNTPCVLFIAFEQPVDIKLVEGAAR